MRDMAGKCSQPTPSLPTNPEATQRVKENKLYLCVDYFFQQKLLQRKYLFSETIHRYWFFVFLVPNQESGKSLVKWRIYPNSRQLTFLMPEVISKISREGFKHEKLNFMRHLTIESNSLYKLFIRSKDQVSMTSHTFSICCSFF